MIKLKKVLKESKYAWDRQFGDPLPTLKDVMETHPKTPLREAKFKKQYKSLKGMRKDLDRIFGTRNGLGNIGHPRVRLKHGAEFEKTGRPAIPSIKYKPIVATPILYPKLIPIKRTTKVCIVIGTG